MDVLLLPVNGGGKPTPIARSKFVEGSPKFSPDGKWLAYCTNESGRPEVFVQPVPGPGPKIQVSVDGGTDPLWRRGGRELYYRNGDKMMIVQVRNSTHLPGGAAGDALGRPLFARDEFELRRSRSDLIQL